ncbi:MULTISPECIES: hypothetical protein [unclassified Sinorhizobium]|uniref:hypothetical protein n=1 Tax=unclassified Sinorhizobium TaxID=2613772 RepID=UPI0024C4703E|nr:MULTISPECIES: hypothetical protein [unclassified Sinorhizobium]MDK1377696.1 hypothetical protein [Sinorhizobium sp. 6-70]MDK1478656.1 hypothetical protein [Sinorhizobium sp. 6-117]
MLDGVTESFLLIAVSESPAKGVYLIAVISVCFCEPIKLLYTPLSPNRHLTAGSVPICEHGQYTGEGQERDLDIFHDLTFSRRIEAASHQNLDGVLWYPPGSVFKTRSPKNVVKGYKNNHSNAESGC